jgi:dihydrofolate synthase/folylpolyglutamate synthase
MARVLTPEFSKIIITTPGSYKISEPEKIFEAFNKAAQKGAAEGKVEFIKDTEEGIKAALRYAKEKNAAVLGTGSFYLAAEIRNYIFSHKDE